MATLRVCLKHPVCRFKPLVASRLICTTTVNLIVLWIITWFYGLCCIFMTPAPNKNAYKPAKYPTTPEERIAAAKKYGLHIDDYIPIKDDGLGAGDYPDLEPKSISARDPYYDWDYPFTRRNYNEVRTAKEEFIKGHKYDESRRYYIPLNKMIIYLFSFVTVLALLFKYLPVNPTYAPMMAKQYPYGNLHLEHGGDTKTVPTIKHYTFEPAEKVDGD